MTLNSSGNDSESLGDLAFASLLTHEELEELRKVKEEKSFRKGDLIIQEGFTASDILVIRKGMAKILKDGNFLKDAIVKIARKSEVLGWESLLNNHNKYSTTAVAITNVEVCILPRKTMMKLIDQNSKFCNFMNIELFNNLENAYQKVGELVHKPIRSRLAEALLMLAQNDERESSDSGINILREDLANIVGATRETVTRILSDFRKDKLVEVKNKTIRILDSQKLKSIGRVT